MRRAALAAAATKALLYRLLLAFLEHINAGDGGFAPALIGLCLLIVSFCTQDAARARQSPCAAARAAGILASENAE